MSQDMTKDEIVRALANIKKEEVMSVYSGRPGCACGCRGKYSYSSLHRGMAESSRGYEITADEVNDAMITRVIKLFQKNVGIVKGFTGTECRILYFDVPSGNRTYTLYFADRVASRH
jgi:hypothetical protein